MEFHERLYEIRKNAGMTQSELAEKLDVSRQAISRWEMGTAKPEFENLIAISNIFDVSIEIPVFLEKPFHLWITKILLILLNSLI